MAPKPPATAADAPAAAAAAVEQSKGSGRSSKGAYVWRRWGLGSDPKALQRHSQQQQQQQQQGQQQEEEEQVQGASGNQSRPIAIPGAQPGTAAAGRGYTNVEPSMSSSNGGIQGWEANASSSGGNSLAGGQGGRSLTASGNGEQQPSQDGRTSKPLQPLSVAHSAAAAAAAALLAAGPNAGDKAAAAAASNGSPRSEQQQEAWSSAAVANRLPGSYPRRASPPLSSSPQGLSILQQRLQGTNSGVAGSAPNTPPAAYSNRMSFDVGGSAFDLPTTAAAASAAAAVPGEAFDPLAAAAAELIRGLKVRIGVATGELDASEEISTSRLLDVTKRRWPGLGPCQGHG